jgi:Fe2+ or Zn2+ uptake regulation protein
MSRNAAAHNVALRDQIAAILRDSDVPLTTPQLADRSGLLVGGGVYPHLRALEKAGVIARVRYPNRDSIRQATLNGTLHQHLIEHTGSRCVHWQYTAPRADDTFAALIAAMEDQ